MPEPRPHRSRHRIHSPSLADLEALAAQEGIALAAGEAAVLQPTVDALVAAARRGEERGLPPAALRPGARDPGGRPKPEDDPFNAFIRRCRVDGATDGPLAGLTVGVKDNIAVGGVPMTEGGFFPAFTPSADSTVVERILDAGGAITGTLNMDELGGGATGVMSAFGAALNPVDPTRTAGGSSGGAGSAVRSGAVDLALGVDQGGSGRIPAAFCGVVAVKATLGLISTYGVGHVDHTLDYVTPMARDVAGAGRLLEVVAGEDWRSPQGIPAVTPFRPYAAARHDGVDGMRIGVIEESLHPECDQDVLEGLERSLEALAAAGAAVERMSLPVWADGFATYQPLVAHLIANMVRSEGVGYGHLGYVDVERLHAFAVARRAQSLNLNPYVKCWLLADRFLHDRHLNVTFGTLQNQRLLLRRALDDALVDFDLLLTPTVPMVAPALFEDEPTVDEMLAHTPAAVAYNTAPLNLTGHPSVCVPSRRGGDGTLPTSVQIVAGRHGEYEAFRAAFAIEAALGDDARSSP